MVESFAENGEHVPRGESFDLKWIIPVYILCILGVVINIFTCSAMLYARYKRRHGFHKDWYKSHIFVFNLTFWDLWCSFFMMVMYTKFAMAGITGATDLGLSGHGCAFLAIIRDIVTYIEVYSVALIAATRMLYISKPTFWREFCSTPWKVVCLIGFEWTLGFIWNINRIKDAVKETSLSKYDICMIVYSNVNKGLSGKSNPGPLIIDYVSHFISFAIVIGGYAMIRYQYHQSQKAIKDTQTHAQEVKSKEKENKITKTMFIICFVYIFGCTIRLSARLLCFLHDTEEDNEQNWCGNSWFIQFNSPCIRLSYIVYYSQFVTNIFIYVFQRDQYWKACKDLLLRITKPISDLGNTSTVISSKADL